MATEALSPFVARHIGPSEAEQARMLADLGLADLEQLVAEVVPAEIRLEPAEGVADLPEGCDEARALAELRAIAATNQVRRSLIGLGYHGCITPALIQRHVLENPAWYTAYTPYQADQAAAHLVSCGDSAQPGPPRGPAQLSDPDQRAHRPADRQRLAAG
jgi:glycine dehydrogenase